MRVFWAFARQSFQTTVIYRFDFWLRVSTILLLMYSIRWVWVALYAQRPSAFGVSLEQMVTYGVLSMAVLNLFYSFGVQYYISEQVRSGAIDLDLLKPLDFHIHMLARSAGEMLFRLFIMIIPAILCGYLFFGLQPPVTSLAGLLFAVTLLIGYLISFHLGFLLGTLSLVTLEVHSIDWAFDALMRLFSGQLVPLWLFPGVLGTLAALLPFGSLLATPLSIYTGVLRGDAILPAIALQLFWLAALALISRWLWGRVQAGIVSQGG
ncbi:MAG TPA: ABC-2 family transporter protein [Anaerolineales bacterium]|nr:ABC-2 family transporter protein [Anaerolineales bacterium]